MQYIAHRHFTVIPRGTDTHINYKPGDNIDEFESWSERAKRWHMDGGYVQKHATTHDVDTLIERRCLKLEQQVAQLQEQLAAAQMPAIDAAMPKERQAALISPDAPTHVPTVEEAVPLACSLCDKQFVSQKALKVHRAKAHGGI